jgi:hypothetical protein
MDYKNTDFPQYRKLSNGKTFYKIIDGKTFEEVQLMGTKRMVYTTIANQYPEMLRIKDMLELQEPYEMSNENEYLLGLNA